MMPFDILIMTLYGGAYGLYLVKLSYDIGHDFHHWLFGIITTLAVIPVIILNVFIPRDYYISTIIMGMIIGPTSFVMDVHDFKKWVARKRKQAEKSQELLKIDIIKKIKKYQDGIKINQEKLEKLNNK